MKKIFGITFFLVALMSLSSCYKETDYDWVDKTDHEFDYWNASHINIFYVNSVNEALFSITDASKCPVIIDKKLTDAEVDSVRAKQNLIQGSTYETTVLSGYYIVNADEEITGFLYYDSGYAWPCLIPYCHIDNSGSATSYIYTIDSDGKTSVDTLVGKYHYAPEDDHWLVEATKMTLNDNDVWVKGNNEVAVVIQK